MSRVVLIIFFLIPVVFSSFKSYSTTKTWTGAVDSLWSTAGNWSPAGVPSCGTYDDVIISASATRKTCLVRNYDACCANLTIDAGAALYTWNSGGTYLLISGNLTINGTMSSFRSPASSSLTLYFNPILIGGTSGSYKTITVGGSADMTKAEIQISMNSGGAYYQLNSDIKLHGFLMNYGGFKMNGHNMTVWQFLNGSTYSNTGTFYLGVGTLKICGTSAHAVFVDLTSGYWDSSGGGSVTYDATGTEWTGSFYSQFAGASYNYVGNQTVKTVSYNNLKICTANGYTVTIGTANLTTSGDFTIINPGTAGGTATTAYTVNIGGNLNIGYDGGGNSGNGLIFNVNHRVYRGSGTGTVNMGTNDNSNHKINVKYLDANGAGNEVFTGFGTPTFYGSVDYGGAGSQEIIASNYYNLYINKDLSASGTKKLLGNISVSDELKIWYGTLSATDGSTARDITLQGNFTNIGTFTSSTGRVTCTGGSAQIFSGNNISFYNLDINKSANNVDITNTSGILVTNSIGFIAGDFTPTISSSPLVLGTSATICDAADDGSHVNGYIAKNTNSTSEFIFPCGNGLKYRYCSITPSSTSARTYRVKYTKSGYGDYSITGTTINHVSSIEYWDIAETSGAATKDAKVKLSWDVGSGVDVNFTDLVIAHYNGTDWEDLPGTYTHSGNATAGDLVCNTNWTTYSPFTLASKTANNILPVELLYFNAIKSENGNELSWATATEVNNDYFTIEKSTNGKNYSLTEHIPHKGTGNSLEEYHYYDNEDYEGAIYYKLSQTDIDGKKTFLKIVSLENNLTTEIEDLVICQNQKHFIIRFNTKNNCKKNIIISDLAGRIIYQISIDATKGWNTYEVPEKPGNGIYILNLENTESRKICIY